MSIIITGIDMPECCIDCPIYDDEFGCCRLIPDSRYYYDGGEYYDPFEEKNDKCPLKEYEGD